jgi:hypothetical protein
LPELDFEGKRQALDMLNITVWLDGEEVEITGNIDTGIVLTPSLKYFPLSLAGKEDSRDRVVLKQIVNHSGKEPTEPQL